MRAPTIRMPAFSFVLSLAAGCHGEESSDVGVGVDSGIDATVVDSGSDVAITDATKEDTAPDVVDAGHEVALDTMTDAPFDVAIDVPADAGPDAAGMGRCYSGIDGYDPDGGYELCEAGSVCSRVSEAGFGAACLPADAFPSGSECGVITCGTADWGCDCVDGAVSACACEFITSTARSKRDIAYVDDAAEERLRRELVSIRLATYRYRPGVTGEEGAHLGFVIEDMPPASPAVRACRTHVDLYGYVSMAVAAIKAQERELDVLRERILRLERRA